MSERHQRYMKAIELQSKEFDAVAELAKQYRRVTMTPPVDDDYQQVRFEYEQALRVLISTLKANGRNFV